MATLNGNGAAGADGTVLSLAGEMTLGEAETLREMLLGALDDAGEVTLDCGAVGAVDVAGLQLLCAAHRTAAARHKCLSLAFPLTAPLLTAIEEAGFDMLHGCRRLPGESRCLWQEPAPAGPPARGIQTQD